MSVTNKSKIINKYGTPVSVSRFIGDMPKEITETKALLGRASKSVSGTLALESDKECIMLPTIDVDSGDFITNLSHSETYIVVATHKEYFMEKALSMVLNIAKCEHEMDVSGLEKTSDGRGNIVNKFVEKYKHVPCYLMYVRGDTKSYDFGLNPDTEYVIYTTDLKILLTEQISVPINGQDLILKVVSTDYTTYPNLVRIECKKDTIRR